MGKCELFIKIHRPIIKLASEIPSNENLILMGNHPNKLDPMLINSVVSNVIFVKDDSLIKTRLIKTIDCDLKSKYMGSMAGAFITLIEKNILCIFPEGEINNEDELKPFVPGAMTLATKSKTNIIPFAITGSYNLIKGDKLKISFGDMFSAAGMNNEELEEYLKNKIYELKRK